jgi:hypothetical protein
MAALEEVYSECRRWLTRSWMPAHLLWKVSTLISDFRGMD